MKMYGGMEVKLHTLTLAPDAVASFMLWLHSVFECGGEQKNSCPAKNQTPVAQPVATLLTELWPAVLMNSLCS
jgi:hypothetical protein